jgi:NAD dependent epimerase/dehydratase family enzyme
MMNWIHIDDLCGIYIRALEDESFRGAYNAVAPNPVNNREFTKAIAQAIHKPIWLPAVPSFVMKILLGDMAYIVLKGGAISSKRVQREGYRFKYEKLDDALRDLLAT